jgi:hypothetical protein
MINRALWPQIDNESWPSVSCGNRQFDDGEEMRSRYIEALRLADQRDYSALLAFVRS